MVCAQFSVLNCRDTENDILLELLIMTQIPHCCDRLEIWYSTRVSCYEQMFFFFFKLLSHTSKNLSCQLLYVIYSIKRKLDNFNSTRLYQLIAYRIKDYCNVTRFRLLWFFHLSLSPTGTRRSKRFTLSFYSSHGSPFYHLTLH